MAGRYTGASAPGSDKQHGVVCCGRNLSDHLLQWEKGQCTEVALLCFLSGTFDAVLSDQIGLAGKIKSLF